MRVNGHGNRSTRSRRNRHRNRCTGTGRAPRLRTITGHVTWLLAAQAQTRKRTFSGQVTGFLTNRTDDGLTSMKDTYKEISHRHRRWDRTTKGHHKTTSTISHGREFTEETRRVENTKRFKNGLNIIIIGYFKRKVTYEHKTDGLIGSADWNRTSPKRRVDPFRRSSRYSADLHVTRTRPFFRNWTAAILSTTRTRNNCGATSDTPCFRWISAGKCSTTLLAKAITANTNQNVSTTQYLPKRASGKYPRPHQCSAVQCSAVLMLR